MSQAPHDLRHLKVRILEDARREPSPVRAVVERQTTWLLATGLAALLGLFVVFGGVQPGPRPRALIVGTAVGWIGIAVWATWIALGRGTSMLGRPRERLIGIALGTPLLLFAWLLAWDVRYPDAGQPCPLAHAIPCFLLTITMAAWPLVAMTLARRRSDPVHPVAMGSALGATAGAWAAVMIDLRCAVTTPLHVALGHVLPAVVLATLGAVLGARVLRMGERQ